MFGVWNKIVRIDLNNKSYHIDSFDETTWKKYIGGSGIGTKILYEEVPENTDPLSPYNKIIFATGPFQGTAVPGSGKWTIVGKSPLTGTFAVSTAGANFGFRLKKAGIDVLVFEGASDTPCYIFIDNDDIKILDAKHLWGKDAVEASNMLTSIHGKDFSTAVIGTAGEKMVAAACIMADCHSFAARCGLGAVLGSKNVKAVVVRGTQTPPVYDSETLKEETKKYSLQLHEGSKESFNKYGTPLLTTICEEVGDLPVKYWNGDTWEDGAKALGIPKYTEELNDRSWPCFACPVGCHRHIKYQDKNGVYHEGAGPEYESIGLLGSACLIDDIKVVAQANDLCNRYGVDTISVGSYTAFTMECYEKGLITKEDLNGIEADFGNSDFLLEMIAQISENRGFGAKFYKGIRPAAESIGPDAEALTVEVKNLDFPAHDPRSYFSLSVNYATGTRGACHLRGYPHCGETGALIPEMGIDKVPERFSMEGLGKFVSAYQDYATMLDSLVCCLFMHTSGMDYTGTLKMLNAVTGWSLSIKDFADAGERAWNMQRLMNLRDGYSSKDDRLPAKMFEPGKNGFRAGKAIYDFDKALQEYYASRGWNTNGIPSREKLLQLEIKL